MKKIRFDKNTILIICLIITFVFLFSVYIFSLVRKNHLRTHGDKESSAEQEIVKAEDDPMYSKYCQGKVEYVSAQNIKKGGLGYTQNITITLTNNSLNPYTGWTIRIPSNNVKIEEIKNASYSYNNGAVYIQSLGSFDKLRANETIIIDALISTPSSHLDDQFKYMVLIDCANPNKSDAITKGNAKLTLGANEVELIPEITIEKVENDETTYALYLKNTNTVAVKSPRLVLSQEYGSFVSLSSFTITENKEARTINAIDLNEPDNMINRGYSSIKYTLVLKGVPVDYKPDIVAAGTKLE